jgi:hypothetical protein
VSTHFLATPLEKILSTNQPNLSSSVMSFEVDLKNVIMVTLEKIPEEQRKAFEAQEGRCDTAGEEQRKATLLGKILSAAEEHRKAEEARELQEFLACFKKERQGKVT